MDWFRNERNFCIPLSWSLSPEAMEGGFGASTFPRESLRFMCFVFCLEDRMFL